MYRNYNRHPQPASPFNACRHRVIRVRAGGRRKWDLFGSWPCLSWSKGTSPNQNDWWISNPLLQFWMVAAFATCCVVSYIYTNRVACLRSQALRCSFADHADAWWFVPRNAGLDNSTAAVQGVSVLQCDGLVLWKANVPQISSVHRKADWRSRHVCFSSAHVFHCLWELHCIAQGGAAFLTVFEGAIFGPYMTKTDAGR